MFNFWVVSLLSTTILDRVFWTILECWDPSPRPTCTYHKLFQKGALPQKIGKGPPKSRSIQYSFRLGLTSAGLYQGPRDRVTGTGQNILQFSSGPLSVTQSRHGQQRTLSLSETLALRDREGASIQERGVRRAASQVLWPFWNASCPSCPCWGVNCERP